MTDWKEVIAEEETAKLERLVAPLRAMQRARAENGRALHLKQHAGVRATLHTFADVPAWARVGIFTSAGERPGYVRFSNGSAGHAPDRAPDVRGIAVKIVGVPGKKLIRGFEEAKTQDFLGILTNTVPFRNPKEFVDMVLAAAGSPLLLLPRMIGAFGFRFFGMLPKLQAPLKTPVPSLGKATFYSALPIRWGETAVKFSFVRLSVPDDAEVPTTDWANRYFNDEAAKRSLERLLACDYFLCGRRTYEMFSKAWPKMSGPYADRLNSMPKLVASTTLSEPLAWNARLVKGDVPKELMTIKEQAGRDIVMYGSPVLMRSLLRHGLIDQLDLVVCPIVIGEGQRLFGDGGTGVELKLAGHNDLATGVVILSYQPQAVFAS